MKRVLCVLLAGLTAACAASSNKAPVRIADTEDGSFALTSVAEPALPPGKCGMILWTLDANRPTPIMRYVSGETANIAVNGSTVDLSLAETSGGGNFGVSEKQVFVGGAGFDAVVDVHFGLGFEGGVYLERGLVKVTSASGWEVVAPAAGIAGCRRK
jgi:hypothetical protein